MTVEFAMRGCIKTCEKELLPYKAEQFLLAGFDTLSFSYLTLPSQYIFV